MRKPKPKTRGRNVVTLSSTEATELFIGGLCGILQLADTLKLKASVGAGIMSTLSMALADLPAKGLLAAYQKIGGELPVEVGAKLLAATAARNKWKPKRKAKA